MRRRRYLRALRLRRYECHLFGETGSPTHSRTEVRISELLQLHNIDPLTVAQQTGTSVAMIEKTYFKFIQSAMRAKLAAVK